MLKIIISPAKKMNVTDDFPVEVTLPHFLEQTEEIKAYLQNLDYGTLKGIWKCNDQIAEQNVERLKNMELRRMERFVKCNFFFMDAINLEMRPVDG